MSGRYHIVQTAPERWDQTLEFFLRRYPPQYRQHRKETLLRRLQLPDAIPLELWHVEVRIVKAGHLLPIVAAGVIEYQPGGIAMAGVPALLSRQFLPAGVTLLREWMDMLTNRGYRTFQVVAEEPLPVHRQMMREAGLDRLTSLLYMVWEPASHPVPSAEEQLAEGLGMEPFRDLPGYWQRLACVVERTYVNSLDCPEVSGLRAVEDTLAGYRLSGPWHPQLWFLLRKDAEDIGCLLLCDRAEEKSLELVYMGIIPEYRGKGLSRFLIAEAQRQTIGLGRLRLVLAVDVRNWPALHVYEKAGFCSFARAEVYQKILG